MKPNLASKDTCTGCMACVDSCHIKALSSYIATDGHLYVKCNDTVCTSCGKCEKKCPIVSHYDYERKGGQSIPYAAWATDDNIRLRSASGGVFAALAKKIIIEGGYVAGAIMDGLRVKHILTNNIDDLVKIQGSKYQQGNLTSIYNHVKDKLDKNKTVLFSGAPCQVAALYSFLGKYKKYDNLITIDIVCGGFPSILPMKVFSEKENITIIESFRDKQYGWKSIGYKYCLTAKKQDNYLTNYGYNNLVIQSFSSSLTNRHCCSNCNFSYRRRHSDLTIADFWGEKNFPEQHFKGVSCIILHNEDIMNFLIHSSIEIHPAKWGEIIPYNPRLVYAKRPYMRFHPARLFIGWNFKYLPMSFLKKIYGGKIEKKDIFWIPYKTSFFSIFPLGT